MTRPLPWTHQLSGVALSLAAGAALAQPLVPPAESRITSVTLYPGSATVERSVRVAAGTRQLRLSCLPAGLDVQSLAATADASVRVGELSALSEAADATPACALTAWDERIRELEDRKATLAAEHESLALVAGYLKGMATPETTPGGGRAAIDPKALGATAEALRRASQEALARQHQIKRLQEELDRQLKPLQAERSRALAGRGRVTTVQITLDAPRDAELRLSYQVNGPGWTPTYRALLDTRSGALRLQRQAQVAQATGEDWTGVAMRLSTGQVRRGTSGPIAQPWRLGIAHPPPEPQARARAAPLAAPAPAPAALAAKVSEGAAEAVSFDASVFNQGFATEFSLPQRVDVPSGGPRVTLALGGVDLQAQLFSRSTPAVQDSVWLVAEAPQPEGVWPQGPLQLYRDGAYLGSDTLRTGGTRPLSLPFGRDEQVSVQVEPAQEQRGSAGFAGSRAERSVTHAYRFENRHGTPVTLQVLEAAPVAVDEQVKVQAQFTPTPDSLAWNEQPGIVLWSQRLAPGQGTRLSAHYSFNWPQDARLQESR